MIQATLTIPEIKALAQGGPQAVRVLGLLWVYGNAASAVDMLCARRGLNRRQTAAALKVHESTVSRLKSDRNTLPDDAVRRLAALLAEDGCIEEKVQEMLK